MSGSTRIALAGLAGDNPLAFLAGVGALRVLTRSWAGRGAALDWLPSSGNWRPQLCVAGNATPADVIDALTAALHGLLADPALARRLGEAGRQRAESDFDTRRMAGDYRRHYLELLASKGMSARCAS